MRRRPNNPRARAAVTYSLLFSSSIKARTVCKAKAVADQPKMKTGSQARDRKSMTRSTDQAASLYSLEKKACQGIPKEDRRDQHNHQGQQEIGHGQAQIRNKA